VTAELLIVGAGPAGVSGALWARSRGLEPLVIEGAPQPGGQLLSVYFHPRELAGVRTGEGPVIAASYAEQLGEAGIPVRYGSAATALECPEGAEARPAVTMADGSRHDAEAVLVASGVRKRRLEVPGERELEGRGVSYSATRDLEHLRGKRVAVVGGGDAAYENALILAAAECEVLLAVRGAPRARGEFRRRVAAERRVTVLERARVAALHGERRLESIRFEGPDGAFERAVDALVVKVGVLPNTEWCRDALSCDAEGFVVADSRQRASRPRVWAAGDVTHPALACIAVAMGTAALAVADIRRTIRPD
jgi:thioredoxin reductase (NADPH)